jgi:hypothetical protein
VLNEELRAAEEGVVGVGALAALGAGAEVVEIEAADEVEDGGIVIGVALMTVVVGLAVVLDDGFCVVEELGRGWVVLVANHEVQSSVWYCSWPFGIGQLA